MGAAPRHAAGPPAGAQLSGGAGRRRASGEVLGGLFFGHSRAGRVHRARRAARRRHRRAGRDRHRQRPPVRAGASAPPTSARTLLEAERAARAEVERVSLHEGRVPRDAVARAAHAAQRDPRLVARSCSRGATDDADARRGPRDHRAQRPRAGAADRGPARHEPDRLRQDPARRAAGRARRRSSRPRSTRCGRRPTRKGDPHPQDRSIRTPARCSAIRTGSSRSSGTCSPTRSSSRRRAARSTCSLQRVNSHVEITVHDTGHRHRAASSCRTCSSGSARPTPRRRASTAGSGWACRSSSSSSSCTAARSRPRAPATGQGATFIVSLPLRAVREPARTRASTRRPPAARRATAPRSRSPGSKVLVVDDEPDARELVRVGARRVPAPRCVTAASADGGARARASRTART